MQTQTLKKEPKVILGAFVDPVLIKKIDTMRGQVPRSRIVEEIMTAFVKAMEENRKNETERE